MALAGSHSRCSSVWNKVSTSGQLHTEFRQHLFNTPPCFVVTPNYCFHRSKPHTQYEIFLGTMEHLRSDDSKVFVPRRHMAWAWFQPSSLGASEDLPLKKTNDGLVISSNVLRGYMVCSLEWREKDRRLMCLLSCYSFFFFALLGDRLSCFLSCLLGLIS